MHEEWENVHKNAQSTVESSGKCNQMIPHTTDARQHETQ